VAALRPATERSAIGSFAHRGRCDSSYLRGLLALGDRFHPAERFQRPFHRLLAKAARVVQAVPKASLLALLVQHPERAILVDFDHDEANRIRSDIDRGKSRLQVGPLVHVCS
jgi:hypothetical protein